MVFSVANRLGAFVAGRPIDRQAPAPALALRAPTDDTR
jgi:hypothetical protein